MNIILGQREYLLEILNYEYIIPDEFHACVKDAMKKYATNSKGLWCQAPNKRTYKKQKEPSSMLSTDSFMMEIGQHPSYRDIENPQMKRFKKVLGNYFPELSTAIRLFSVNVGIGSFVYLRRIIEKLVYDTFKEAEAAGVLTEQEFEYREAEDGKKYRNGIEEKIKLLKGFLPAMITDQPQIYGIVSKGIHELSEDECLKYFPVVKDGIIMILDDIVAKKEKEKAAAEYKKSMNGIITDLK